MLIANYRSSIVGRLCISSRCTRWTATKAMPCRDSSEQWTATSSPSPRPSGTPNRYRFFIFLFYFLFYFNFLIYIFIFIFFYSRVDLSVFEYWYQLWFGIRKDMRVIFHLHIDCWYYSSFWNFHIDLLMLFFNPRFGVVVYYDIIIRSRRFWSSIWSSWRFLARYALIKENETQRSVVRQNKNSTGTVGPSADDEFKTWLLYFISIFSISGRRVSPWFDDIFRLQ